MIMTMEIQFHLLTPGGGKHSIWLFCSDPLEEPPPYHLIDKLSEVGNVWS